MKLTTLATALAVTVAFAQSAHAREHSHGHGISHRYDVHQETGRHWLRTVTRQRGLHITIRLGATEMRRRHRSPGRRRARTGADTADARAPGAVGRCGSSSAAIRARNSTSRAIGRAGDTPGRQVSAPWSYGRITSARSSAAKAACGSFNPAMTATGCVPAHSPSAAPSPSAGAEQSFAAAR